MPFLLPASSSSLWPPQRNDIAKAAGSDGRREILLKNHHVSVEPTVLFSTTTTTTTVISSGEDVDDTAMVAFDSIDATLGPAFFFDTATSAGNDHAGKKDPSLFTFEMAMYVSDAKTNNASNNTKSTIQMTPPSDENRSRTTETPCSTANKAGKVDDDNNGNDAAEGNASATVFFRIESRIYQVDLCQASCVEEIRFDDYDETATPPSLVIQFPFCRFRVFVLPEEHDQAQVSSTLNAIRTRLAACIKSVATVSSQRFDTSLASPSGASTTTSGSSSNELGQREFATRAGAIQKSYDSSGGSNNKSCDSGNTDGIPLHNGVNGVKIQSTSGECTLFNKAFATFPKKLSGLDDSSHDLQSVQQLLDIPKTTLKMTSEHGELFGRLLMNIGESLASSYCSRDQLQAVEQACNTELAEHEKQLDELLVAYFPPSSRPKKRPRRECSDQEEDINEIINGQDGDESRHTNQSMDAVLLCARRILQRQRSVVESRHAISLLPHRG